MQVTVDLNRMWWSGFLDFGHKLRMFNHLGPETNSAWAQLLLTSMQVVTTHARAEFGPKSLLKGGTKLVQRKAWGGVEQTQGWQLCVWRCAIQSWPKACLALASEAHLCKIPLDPEFTGIDKKSLTGRQLGP